MWSEYIVYFFSIKKGKKDGCFYEGVEARSESRCKGRMKASCVALLRPSTM